MKPVYQQLREYREAHGITQTHIARKMGKSNRHISAIETGAVRLTADELVEICVIGYEISPAIFFANNFSVSDKLGNARKPHDSSEQCVLQGTKSSGIVQRHAEQP